MQYLCNSMTCYQVSLTLFHLVPSLRKDTLYSGTGSHSNYEHDYCNGCTSHSLHQCQQVQRSHQTIIWCQKNQPTGSYSQHQWRHYLHNQTSFLANHIDIALVLTPVWWFARVCCLAHFMNL